MATSAVQAYQAAVNEDNPENIRTKLGITDEDWQLAHKSVTDRQRWSGTLTPPQIRSLLQMTVRSRAREHGINPDDLAHPNSATGAPGISTRLIAQIQIAGYAAQVRAIRAVADSYVAKEAQHIQEGRPVNKKIHHRHLSPQVLMEGATSGAAQSITRGPNAQSLLRTIPPAPHPDDVDAIDSEDEYDEDDDDDSSPPSLPPSLPPPSLGGGSIHASSIFGSSTSSSSSSSSASSVLLGELLGGLASSAVTEDELDLYDVVFGGNDDESTTSFTPSLPPPDITLQAVEDASPSDLQQMATQLLQLDAGLRRSARIAAQRNQL